MYICGRSKDLIIIHGKNHYPQDIEVSTYAVSDVKQGSVAAITVVNYYWILNVDLSRGRRTINCGLGVATTKSKF